MVKCKHHIKATCPHCQPTRIIMVKCKHHIKATCPHCHYPKEDVLHLSTCPHPNDINLWKEALNNLHTWLLNADIHPAIVYFICSSLTSWTNDPFSEEVSIDHLPQNICQTFENQLQLGWFTAFIWSSALFPHPTTTKSLQHHHIVSYRFCMGQPSKSHTLEFYIQAVETQMQHIT